MNKIINIKVKTVISLIVIIALGTLLSSCTKNVTDEEISVQFQKEDYTGKYTGVFENNQANGAGDFEYKDGDDYLTYKGEFKDGQFADKGTLKTNILKVELPEVTRTGEYDGDVIDGVPNGQGTFTAVNSDNEKYTYTGEWKDGTWNGQGTRKFENKKHTEEIGNFTDGEFDPTKLELFETCGKGENIEFVLTEKAKQFIATHDDIFPVKNKKLVQKYTDTNLKYKHIQKNPDNYGDKLIKLDDYKVAQILEEDIWNGKVTQILAVDKNYENIIYILYLGKTKLYEGDKLAAYGLPLNRVSWGTIMGGELPALAIAGSYIEKL